MQDQETSVKYTFFFIYFLCQLSDLQCTVSSVQKFLKDQSLIKIRHIYELLPC